MTKRKKNIIGHDPLAWISVDDEDEIEEVKAPAKTKSTARSKPEPHPLGIDVNSFMLGFELMQDNVGDIVSDFYTTLFSDYPEVKSLFAGSDIKEQERKLAGAIGLLVNNINDVDKLVSVLSGLGKSHQKYGATEEHYVAVANTLLTVIKQHIGRKWTKKIAENWEIVLTKSAEVMLGAYEETTEPSEQSVSTEIDVSQNDDEEGVFYLQATQDISTVEELLDNLKACIGNGQVKINISNVNRIDAACLQVLYLVFRDADINGYEAKITGTSENFEHAVRLLGMNNILKVAA